MTEIRTSPDAVVDALASRSYLADRSLATVLYLALVLGKPLLLEGEAGVGKTELAKVTADALGARLIRLQCYEGIDVAHALYDWAYAKQMLYIRTLEATGHAATATCCTTCSASSSSSAGRCSTRSTTTTDVPPVLLIDEIDRADDEFEAFLLELLSDFQVTIPEIGTSACKSRPVVFLTSNRTRELHEALKRRCLYMWVPHPELDREIEIVRARVPGRAGARWREEAARFVAKLRTLDLAKAPGVAETIDWTQALMALGEEELSASVVDATLGSVLKYHEDIEKVRDADLARHGRGGEGDAVSDGQGPRLAGDAVVRKLVTFGRILREAGVEVGPGRLQDALRALDAIDLSVRDEVYSALACTLVAKHDDLEIFDRAFRAWFERAPSKNLGQRPIDLGLVDMKPESQRGRGTLRSPRSRWTRSTPTTPSWRPRPSRPTSCSARRTSPR